MRRDSYIFDPAATFSNIVEYIYDDVIFRRKAPGLMVGLSGTDSLVVFVAAYDALEKAGKPMRLLGVHFAPSEDFLADHPEAEAHNWFAEQIVPWLRERCPEARIEVNRTIDWRLDGIRWGAMLDMSILEVDDKDVRHMLPHDEKYWIVGTRNRTENALYTYSRASLAASVQPIVHLWKSEILKLSYYLKLPKIAMEKSCEADCICGRERLPAKHVRELDTLLMIRMGVLPESAADKIPLEVRVPLEYYIHDQIGRCNYKDKIPYMPELSPVRSASLVDAFVAETLDLREFDHRRHLYVAWYYLMTVPFEEALEKYCLHLRNLLEKAGVADKYNYDVTKSYFHRLKGAIMLHPGLDFDELMDVAGEALK